jgi:DHA1 family bicyclomycin/chloramphenicol resistance-like MFS transporter
MLMLVTGTAPILAPIIGAQLLHVTDWRGIFVAFAIFGAILLLISALTLPETLPENRRRPLSFREIRKTCGRLLTDRPFITCTISCGLTFAAMFAYIAGASFVLQSPEYSLTPQQFSIVFAANSIGIVTVGQINGRLTGRFSTERLFLIGLAANAAGGVALLAAAITGAGLTTMLVALFVSMASVGMVQPNGTALAMADHPDTAGMASALLGVLQFLIGGLAAPLTGIGGSTSAIPMAMVIAGCGLLALFTFTRR